MLLRCIHHPDQHCQEAEDQSSPCRFQRKDELKNYSREEYYSTWVAHEKLLYNLQHKAGLIKSKRTLDTNKALEARVATVEAKTDCCNNESLFTKEKPKANIEIIQPLTERGVATDIAEQTVDSYDSWTGAISPVSWKKDLPSLWPPSKLWC